LGGHFNFTLTLIIAWENLAGHEAGHLMGLVDRYTDITDAKGNVIDFVIHKNWDGNIMAGPPGEAWNNNLFEMISFARTNHRLIIRR